MTESRTSFVSLSDQISEFNVGFSEAVGPELAAVFAGEQRALNAAGIPSGVVQVGDLIPDAPLLTPSGTPTSLAAELAGAPTVLVFYRGAWCPYCNLTLKHYQSELLPALTERGIGLVALSPQTPEGSTKAVGNGELGFGVFSDPDGALIRELGILTEPSSEARAAHTALGFDVADSNSDSTAGIPFPSILIVDSEGIVRFVDVHVDYTTRTEVDEILAVAAELS